MSLTAPATAKQRPILFSGPMVRAILAGTKTQTRRVAKGEYLAGPDVRYCPYGVPGDRVYVREAFYVDLIPFDKGPLPKSQPGSGHPRYTIHDSIYYRADGSCCDQIPECCCGEVGPVRWRPSIHMPRWASRTTLEITQVRVQRVQEISEEDARAEGAPEVCDHCGNAPEVEAHWVCEADYEPEISHRVGFSRLWDSINDKRGFGWQANPWVWCVSFRRVERAQPS